MYSKSGENVNSYQWLIQNKTEIHSFIHSEADSLLLFFGGGGGGVLTVLCPTSNGHKQISK